MKKLIASTALTALVLTGCSSAETVETKDAAEVVTAQEGNLTYEIDASQSQFNWEAYKIVGGHSGSVEELEGSVFFEGESLKGGDFTIDLNTITSDNDGLTTHLKNDDFFDVPNHPTATFEITAATELADDPAHTHTIEGNLTIKGITNNITFPANLTKEGESYTASATFDIDRTLWGINYKSAAVFEDIGDAAIKDNVTFDLKLITGPAL